MDNTGSPDDWVYFVNLNELDGFDNLSTEQLHVIAGSSWGESTGAQEESGQDQAMLALPLEAESLFVGGAPLLYGGDGGSQFNSTMDVDSPQSSDGPLESFHDSASSSPICVVVGLSCVSCSKTFKRRCDLNKHVNAKMRHWRCKFCSRRLQTKRDYQRHEKTHGLVQKNFFCLICLVPSSRRDNLLKHMKLKHKDVPKHERKQHILDITTKQILGR